MNHKYPKFKLLVLSIFFASILFSLINHQIFHTYFMNLGYFGIFLAGLFYSYSFLAPFSVGILIVISEVNPLLNLPLAAFVAAFGSAVSDLVILAFIKDSLTDEIRNLMHERYVSLFRSKIHNRIKKIFTPILGFIVLASPLPDELGITLLSNVEHLNKKLFFITCMAVNSIGIWVILKIGSVV